MAKHWKGTHHNDSFTGVSISNVFNLRQGGHDTATGGYSDDLFIMGAALDAGDHLVGYNYNDSVWLNGDYSGGLTLGANTLSGIGILRFNGAYDYDITSDDGTVDAGRTLHVKANNITGGHGATFDGSAETNGHFVFRGSDGSDSFTGGALRDEFRMGDSSGDTVFGGGGGDYFSFGGGFEPVNGDQVDGGGGNDLVSFNGGGFYFLSAVDLDGSSNLKNVETLTLGAGHNYHLRFMGAISGTGTFTVNASQMAASDIAKVEFSNSDTIHFTGGASDDQVSLSGRALTAADHFDTGAGDDELDLAVATSVTLGAHTIAGLEHLGLFNLAAYSFTTNDGNVDAGATLEVNGFASGSLMWNGSAETNGHFNITGGGGNDTLIGGAGADTIAGGAGNNTMRGGGGADDITCQVDADTLIYNASSDSASVNYDTVSGFDAGNDKFDLFFSVSSIDAQSFSVDSSSFDTDMGSHLSDYVCTIVTATGSGDLLGHTFLVINADTGNGYSYEAGVDLVIDITGYTGTLTSANFI